jgi:hypothetical protein
MSLGTRYTPAHPAGDAVTYGLDLSALLPWGVAPASCSLTIVTNQNPVQSQSDFAPPTCEIRGRRVYARLSGGQAGVDYQLRWLTVDTMGNTWQRTMLLLCATTS